MQKSLIVLKIIIIICTSCLHWHISSIHILVSINLCTFCLARIGFVYSKQNVPTEICLDHNLSSSSTSQLINLQTKKIFKMRKLFYSHANYNLFQEVKYLFFQKLSKEQSTIFCSLST